MNTVVNQGVYPNGLFGGGVRCLCEFGPQGFRGDELFAPYHCDASNTGDIAIADTENHRIQIFQSAGYTSIFPPFGGQGFGEGQFNHPKSVKYSAIPGTNIAVADTGNRRVCLLRINFKLGKLEHVRSFGQTQFQEPTDLAIDRRNGNIIVVDTALNKVLIMNQYGQFQGCLEERGFNFHRPTSVAVTHDGKSDIYVSDTGNHCIRRFTCNGDYVGVLGKLGSAEGEFNNPRGKLAAYAPYPVHKIT